MIWVGLDLHKQYITACAVDDGGAVVAEHRRLPPEAETLVAWLQALGGPVTVAMEATLYWAAAGRADGWRPVGRSHTFVGG